MHARHAILLAALLVPGLAHADAGAWYEDDAHLDASTPLVGDTVRYLLPLQAGDVVTAVVSWSDPDALVSTSISTSNLCRAAPEPDVDCLLGSPVLGQNRCDLSNYERVLGGSSEAATATATKTATYAIGVSGFLAPDGVDVHVHIQVNGAAPASVTKDDTIISGTTTPAVCWTE